MHDYNHDYRPNPWLAVTIIILLVVLIALMGCASDGSLAVKGKPLDKEQTRLAMCEGAQKIDIAFQTIAANAPGVIPANVMDVEGTFINTVGFSAGRPDPARPGSVCAKLYTGDLDVAINTAIIAVTNISALIRNWQR